MAPEKKVFTVYFHGTGSNSYDLHNVDAYYEGELISILANNDRGKDLIDKIEIDGPASGKYQHDELWVEPTKTSDKKATLSGDGWEENVQHVVAVLNGEHNRDLTKREKLSKSEFKKVKKMLSMPVSIDGENPVRRRSRYEVLPEIEMDEADEAFFTDALRYHLMERHLIFDDNQEIVDEIAPVILERFGGLIGQMTNEGIEQFAENIAQAVERSAILGEENGEVYKMREENDQQYRILTKADILEGLDQIRIEDFDVSTQRNLPFMLELEASPQRAVFERVLREILLDEDHVENKDFDAYNVDEAIPQITAKYSAHIEAMTEEGAADFAGNIAERIDNFILTGDGNHPHKPEMEFLVEGAGGLANKDYAVEFRQALMSSEAEVVLFSKTLQEELIKSGYSGEVSKKAAVHITNLYNEKIEEMDDENIQKFAEEAVRRINSHCSKKSKRGDLKVSDVMEGVSKKPSFGKAKKIELRDGTTYKSQDLFDLHKSKEKRDIEYGLSRERRIYAQHLQEKRVQIFSNGEKPDQINIIGWSRGAVSSIMLANALAKDVNLRDVPVRIFAIDPVPGLRNADSNSPHRIKLGSNVKEYVGIYCADERSQGFSPIVPIIHKSTKFSLYSVRGRHATLVGNIHVNGTGSGDIDMSLNAPYQLTRDFAERKLEEWGTKLDNTLDLSWEQREGYIAQMEDDHEKYKKMRDTVYTTHEVERGATEKERTMLHGIWYGNSYSLEPHTRKRKLNDKIIKPFKGDEIREMEIRKEENKKVDKIVQKLGKIERPKLGKSNVKSSVKSETQKLENVGADINEF